MDRCKFCDKIIKKKKSRGDNRKFCNSDCRKQYRYDLCKCGNKKRRAAKQCWKCHTSNKHRFQVSRTK